MGGGEASRACLGIKMYWSRPNITVIYVRGRSNLKIFAKKFKRRVCQRTLSSARSNSKTLIIVVVSAAFPPSFLPSFFPPPTTGWSRLPPWITHHPHGPCAETLEGKSCRLGSYACTNVGFYREPLGWRCWLDTRRLVLRQQSSTNHEETTLIQLPKSNE